MDNPLAALTDTNDLEWIDTGGGNAFKPLWYSDETGAWTALIKGKAGQVNPPHTHLGPADFYVLTGSIDYRGGSAGPGAWVYEPAGAVHDATTHPVETVYLANVRGPIAYHGPDGKVVAVSNGEFVRDALARRKSS